MVAKYFICYRRQFGCGLLSCSALPTLIQIREIATDMNLLSAKHAPKEADALCRCWHWWAISCLCVILAGCALPRSGALHHRDAERQQAASSLLSTPAVTAHWEQLALPGKNSRPFEPTRALGEDALRVKANNSISILRQRFGDGLPAVGRLGFSWKIDVLPLNADLRDPQAEDAPVRIVLAFAGDRSLLNARTHRLSELSRLLTGEELPYATLAYVWSAHDPLETVVHNPRTDRIRKLVVETGDLSLGQWLRYERDVQADFVRAFGEMPGPLLAVALMTDTDNTSSQLQAWYGRFRLEARQGQGEQGVQADENTRVTAPDDPPPR
jgi:hypothetical protein